MKTRALKRGAALALILALIAGFFPLVIPLASASSPTTITDETGLRAISSDLTGDYILGNDIALQSAWTPIGDSTNAFTGTFDGGGFTISGLSINTSSSNTGGIVGVDTGAVTGKNEGGAPAVSNTYYLSGSYTAGVGNDAGSAEVKTDEVMKLDVFVVSLGSAFNKAESVSQNGGYPVLKWQGGVTGDKTPSYCPKMLVNTHGIHCVF